MQKAPKLDIEKISVLFAKVLFGAQYNNDGDQDNNEDNSNYDSNNRSRSNSTNSNVGDNENLNQTQLLEEEWQSLAEQRLELKEMKSEFVEKRAYLMELKMESRVIKSLREIGIKPAKIPPVKLIVESNKK